jgi:hypothetical protein
VAIGLMARAVQAGEGASGGPLEGGVDAAKGLVSIEFRGKPLMTYAFAGNQFKPYVRALWTLRGENVLRDAPADHLHHHGLMLALRVNGVNFWEERSPAGRQVPVGSPELTFGSGQGGRPEAAIRQIVEWRTPVDRGPEQVLLRETREIRVSVNAGEEEVALEWRSGFETGVDEPRYVLHGPDYHGLGLRFPVEFDHAAVFANSAGLPYSEAQTFDVRPAAWTSSSGRMDGREVQVVLVADGANPGRSSFFSMRNAFAYLASTPETSREPLEFRKGEKFAFRYLLLVYPAHQNASYLNDRLGPWLTAGGRGRGR